MFTGVKVILLLLAWLMSLLRFNYFKETEIDSLRRVRGAQMSVATNAEVEAIVNPLAQLNRFSMKIVHAVLTEMKEITGIGDDVSLEDLTFLVKLSAEANVIDYNTPDMVALRTSVMEAHSVIGDRLTKGGRRTLAINFGGEYFLGEFYRRYIESEDEYTISIYPDNNGQGMVTLKLADVCLRGNSNLRIFFVPKHGQHTNDLSVADTLKYIAYDIEKGSPLLKVLSEELGIMDKYGNVYLVKKKHMGGSLHLVKADVPINEHEEQPRFIILEDGPQVQGISPGSVSRTVVRTIQESDAIVAEGQAFAEIRGWRKPVYFSFMIKGRAAAAVHGEDKNKKLIVFTRIPPGAIHYHDVEVQMSRYYYDPVTGDDFGVAGMTTREFMEVVFSLEWQELVRRFGTEEAATQFITDRMLEEDVSFRQIVLNEAGVDRFSIEFPKEILGYYSFFDDKQRYGQLAEMAGIVALALDATILQQRSVWTAAATWGLEDDIETSLDSIQSSAGIRDERMIPGIFTHEIHFLSRILGIAEIILAGINSGKSETEIVYDVNVWGTGPIFTRIIGTLIKNGMFIEEIRQFIEGGEKK